MEKRTINVLIVDDSAVARDLLAFIVQSDPQLNVMGFAENGEEALNYLKDHTPDVIIMDIVMPKMNGFELTRRIMETRPLPIIVVSGIYNREEVDKSFKAIEAGALAILEKPKGIGTEQYLDTARFVIETIKAMSEVKFVAGKNVVFPGQPQKTGETTEPESALDTSPKIEAVAIGASIGGPQALSVILSKLPATFPVPIFVVQHISGGFIQGLVNWLNESTPLTVRLAIDGEKAIPGYVYVAPDKTQMEILEKNVIKLTEDKSETQPAPAISNLFRSMANIYGAKGVGILLTGVGKDGAEDLLAMKQKGALTIVQNEESCVMFDMPRQAIQLGAAERIEPLNLIPLTLTTLI